MKKFIIKTAVKIVIFVVVMILVTSLLHSVNPLVSNHIALGQMQNSDEAFVFMNTYRNVRTIANIALAVITIWFTSTIARDTYKFIKTTKTTKENNHEEN